MPQLPSGLPESIDDDEDLARFLVSSSQYNTTSVKPSAFLPSSKDNETSVFRHGSKPVKELWKIGAEAIAGRNLHGAAILKAREVRNAMLEVFADEPPLRHAAIRNWPQNMDSDLQKARQKELAILLASFAGQPLLR